MEPPKFPLTGSCLCGAVRVSVSMAPLLTLACHCRDCQKLTASAFSMTMMVPSAGFSCSGEVVVGGLGSSARTHYYCKSCLNFVYSQIAAAKERVNLRISILDEGAAFEPFVEVMTQDKLPWTDVPAVHSFAQYPASLEVLAELMEAYAARAG